MLDSAYEAQYEASRTLREQLKAKIAKVDRQEDGYLDLIGDPEWPKEKVSQRLRQVRDESERLQRQLASTDHPQINARREAIEILLDLLNKPREIYRLATLQTQTPASSSRGLPNDHLVEVRGIEPRSITALAGLLRAQLAVSLLGPTDHASKSV